MSEVWTFCLFFFFKSANQLNTNLLRVTFRLEKPETSVLCWWGIAPARLPLAEPQSCFPGSGCSSRAGHGPFASRRQPPRDSPVEELSPGFGLKLTRFPYFRKAGCGGACWFSALASLTLSSGSWGVLYFSSATLTPLPTALPLPWDVSYSSVSSLETGSLHSSPTAKTLGFSLTWLQGSWPLFSCRLPPISACDKCLRFPFSDDWNGTFSPQTISLVPNAPVYTP